jgi:hypothetical protein
MKNAAVEDMVAIAKHINNLRITGRLVLGVAPSIATAILPKKRLATKGTKSTKGNEPKFLIFPFVLFVPFVANLPRFNLYHSRGSRTADLRRQRAQVGVTQEPISKPVE